MRVSRKLMAAMVLRSLLAVLSLPSAARADQRVVFLDPNLEAAIRETIAKPSGDIYKSDLEDLTSLSADSRGVLDLTGLEYCTSFTPIMLLCISWS